MYLSGSPLQSNGHFLYGPLGWIFSDKTYKRSKICWEYDGDSVFETPTFWLKKWSAEWTWQPLKVPSKSCTLAGSPDGFPWIQSTIRFLLLLEEEITEISVMSVPLAAYVWGQRKTVFILSKKWDYPSAKRDRGSKKNNLPFSFSLSRLRKNVTILRFLRM
jgi:hypothetical protein